LEAVRGDKIRDNGQGFRRTHVDNFDLRMVMVVMRRTDHETAVVRTVALESGGGDVGDGERGTGDDVGGRG
jgi:hypothetical protein